MGRDCSYRSRITLDISEEQARRLDKLPWGIRKHVFAPIVDQFLDLYEKHGEAFLGAVMARRVQFGKEYSDGDD